VLVHEPVADADEARHEYGVELTPWEQLPAAAAIVAAVAHRQFKERPLTDYRRQTAAGRRADRREEHVQRGQLVAQGVTVWRL
jgi:UDP-N-acetyl-D-galactosamine dehydrogenase